MKKSSLFFSKNTQTEVLQSIVTQTGITKVEDLGKYLGIPAIHGRLRKDTYTGLIERTQTRLAGWKAKTLSLAGRKILAKAVLSSIPYYTMQSTLLPKGVTRKIEQLIRSFLWDSSPDSKKSHLVNCDVITKSLDNGGLGFRKLDAMNEAFHNKLGWRILQDENSLWVQVLKSKYAFSANDCSSWHSKSNMSNVWKGILKTVPNLLQSVKKIVRNGHSTQFWNES